MLSTYFIQFMITLKNIQNNFTFKFWCILTACHKNPPRLLYIYYNNLGGFSKYGTDSGIHYTSTEKIDGVVVIIMALDRAIRCGLDDGESVYDERGILLL